jgi:hypothetical protein
VPHRLDRVPLRICQVARVAPAVILVSLPRLVSPYRTPPCRRITLNWLDWSNRL